MSRRFKLTSPRPPRLTENDVEAACLDLLRYRGYYPIRLHVGTFRTLDGGWMRVGDVGLPDYVVLHATLPGFLMETKRPGGKLRPQQATKRVELKLAYDLEVVAIDSTEALSRFLRQREPKPKA